MRPARQGPTVQNGGSNQGAERNAVDALLPGLFWSNAAQELRSRFHPAGPLPGCRSHHRVRSRKPALFRSRYRSEIRRLPQRSHPARWKHSVRGRSKHWGLDRSPCPRPRQVLHRYRCQRCFRHPPPSQRHWNRHRFRRSYHPLRPLLRSHRHPQRRRRCRLNPRLRRQHPLLLLLLHLSNMQEKSPATETSANTRSSSLFSYARSFLPWV
jgi:hypothetical protein